VTTTGDPFGDATDMFAGQVMVSVGGDGGGAEATIVTATLTVTACVPLTTRNEVVYGCVCVANPDVWNVSVSVTLFVPLVGDTVTHGAAGGSTVHLRAPAPVFLTCTVCEGALVPTFVCTLTDVGTTESVACAATGWGRRIATTNRRSSRTLFGQRIRICIADAGGINILLPTMGQWDPKSHLSTHTSALVRGENWLRFCIRTTRGTFGEAVGDVYPAGAQGNPALAIFDHATRIRYDLVA
jgi:hypothetical protein